MQQQGYVAAEYARGTPNLFPRRDAMRSGQVHAMRNIRAKMAAGSGILSQLYYSIILVEYYYINIL